MHIEIKRTGKRVMLFYPLGFDTVGNSTRLLNQR